MKRLLLLLGLLCAFFAEAGATRIHGIRIDVTLERDGSARVCEIWDITADRGTEWYLVKGNLDHITVSDFSVSENARVFENIGKWDVDRNLAQKSGKCGIVRKSNGCELCWGLGSMGRHVFTATYRLHGLVEAFHEADGLHFQFVSPGLGAEPEEVEIHLIPGEGVAPFSTENARIWAFGYNGTSSFSNGEIVARTDGKLSERSSVILLARFDKGVFSPLHVTDKDFSDVQERAMEGADFGDDDDRLPWVARVFMVLFTVVIPVLSGIGVAAAIRKRNRKLFGVTRLSQIDWCREVPFGGDLLQSDYILRKVNTVSGGSAIASAMILRMIDRGQLVIRHSGRNGKQVEIAFNDTASQDALSESERMLYRMMKAASGSDEILQKHEFSRWSQKNAKTIEVWISTLESESRKRIVDQGHVDESGQVEARKVIGLKKFLNDFTLVRERSSAEVALWNEYLVFGALYGIADKVAKELAEINPELFKQTIYNDPYTARQVVWMSRDLSNGITNAAARSSAAAARSGFGGRASFGGGGGFHGGGFGGGAR
ncbi:MAG: DUF2207 domain-containing protein [Bacteroidales bacterium]|nr:DUF2207 domain-containing protein [Bacteroidales bacterium]